MSFSTEVKNELCRVSMQRACCTRAEVYGALLHASVFSHKEIRLSAENMTVVRRLQALLQRAFFVECEPQKAGRKQQLVITEPAQIGRVFDALGYDCKSHITYHITAICSRRTAALRPFCAAPSSWAARSRDRTRKVISS